MNFNMIKESSAVEKDTRQTKYTNSTVQSVIIKWLTSQVNKSANKKKMRLVIIFKWIMSVWVNKKLRLRNTNIWIRSTKSERDRMSPSINSSPKKLNFFSHVKYEHMIAGVSGMNNFLSLTMRKSRWVTFVSGGVTSTLILHPLDLIKIRFAGKFSALSLSILISHLMTHYSQRWTNYSSTVSRSLERILHNISTRRLSRPLQRCNTKCLGIRKCMGILFSIVSSTSSHKTIEFYIVIFSIVTTLSKDQYKVEIRLMHWDLDYTCYVLHKLASSHCSWQIRFGLSKRDFACNTTIH